MQKRILLLLSLFLISLSLTGCIDKIKELLELEEENEELEPLDPYARVPNVAQKRFEEAVSEEYDEIFHNSNDNDDEEPLLN